MLYTCQEGIGFGEVVTLKSPDHRPAYAGAEAGVFSCTFGNTPPSRGTPVIALLSDAVLASHTRGNIQEVAARGAKVLTIAEENIAKEGDDIVLNNVHPYLSPISMVVPTQLIAYFATLHRGLDVDKPRNLYQHLLQCKGCCLFLSFSPLLN